MLMRLFSLFFVLFLASFGSAFAACGNDTPPPIATANGLTQQTFCDDFNDLNSIDAANTMVPGTCNLATVPIAKCHWYVNNTAPKSAFTIVPGLAVKYPNQGWASIPPTLPGEYSIGSGGLVLQPTVVDTTGNNVSGTKTISNIANVTGLLTTSGVVTGTGVPVGTSFSLVGNTATLSNATTAGSTGGAYEFANVHNGVQLSTCGFPGDGSVYVGTTFTGSMFVRVTASFGAAGPLWTGIESYPQAWLFSTELLTGIANPGLQTYELDLWEADFSEEIHGAWTNGDGNYYWQNVQPPAGQPTQYSIDNSYYGQPVGVLMMAPSSNVGGAGVGSISHLQLDNVVTTWFYGPTVAPHTNTFNPGNPVGTFGTIANDHYCLQILAAPHWPMTVRKVEVWQAPTAVTTGGGGRRSIFR